MVKQAAHVATIGAMLGPTVNSSLKVSKNHRVLVRPEFLKLAGKEPKRDAIKEDAKATALFA